MRLNNVEQYAVRVLVVSYAYQKGHKHACMQVGVLQALADKGSPHVRLLAHTEFCKVYGEVSRLAPRLILNL